MRETPIRISPIFNKSSFVGLHKRFLLLHPINFKYFEWIEFVLKEFSCFYKKNVRDFVVFEISPQGWQDWAFGVQKIAGGPWENLARKTSFGQENYSALWYFLIKSGKIGHWWPENRWWVRDLGNFAWKTDFGKNKDNVLFWGFLFKGGKMGYWWPGNRGWPRDPGNLGHKTDSGKKDILLFGGFSQGGQGDVLVTGKSGKAPGPGEFAPENGSWKRKNHAFWVEIWNIRDRKWTKFSPDFPALNDPCSPWTRKNTENWVPGLGPRKSGPEELMSGKRPQWGLTRVSPFPQNWFSRTRFFRSRPREPVFINNFPVHVYKQLFINII